MNCQVASTSIYNVDDTETYRLRLKGKFEQLNVHNLSIPVIGGFSSGKMVRVVASYVS